jgi:hypothetical protein
MFSRLEILVYSELFPVLENSLNKMIDVFADEAWPYTQAVM